MSILMTVEELAKYLKIKPDTIYKKVRKGELPAIKLGKLVRFPKELIDEWIVGQATKTMKEVKAAKKMVEAEVGKAVGKVERAAKQTVDQVVDQVTEQAEYVVGEVNKTQENLTKSVKGLWKDLNKGITKTTNAMRGKKKKATAKKKKIVKTKGKKVAKSRAVSRAKGERSKRAATRAAQSANI